MPTGTKWPYQRVLPIWLWVFLALIAGVLLWARSDAETSDPGIANVNTMLLGILTLVVGGIWFLFLSRFARRTRLLTFVSGLTLLILFLGLFRFESFSGNMIPIFGLRSAAEQEVEPAVGAGGIDLATTTDNDFPGFLGPDRSMTVSHVRLAQDWSSQPPELIWKQPIGAGWSAFAIVNGNAVTMEERDEQQQVSAYDLMTGTLHWTHSWPGGFFHVLGGNGPRSTPFIDEGRVYALGASGMLFCLDGSSGKVLWQKDLLQEFGVTQEEEFAEVGFGRSNSPLIVGDLVVVPAGGNPNHPPASLVAYDKRTGEKRWEGGNRQVSFSSPRLATLGGVEQILIVNEDTASGHDPATGRTLWEHPWPGVTSASASSSQAVPIAPNRVFLSKGYGGGSALIELLPRGDGGFETEQVWHNRRVLRTKFTNVAVLDGHAYGLSQGILECVRLESGERVWKKGRYGHGQILLVGRMLLVMSEDGELSLVEATPDRPNEVRGTIQALEGPSWANLALYGPYLALRNAREAAVYKLPLAPGSGPRDVTELPSGGDGEASQHEGQEGSE